MSKRHRRNHAPEFKAKVALAAVRNPPSSPSGWVDRKRYRFPPSTFNLPNYSGVTSGTHKRLLAAGIEPSVGRRGDSYDNALAESVMGLFKTEVIRRRGPWRGFDDVEFATLERVWWFNHRLLEPLGYVPPAEYEEQFHTDRDTPAAAALT